MSLKQIFRQATEKAQHENSCHKKLLKFIENAFVKTDVEEFIGCFFKTLYKFYYSDYCADKNPYISRGLEFLAKVAVKVTLNCVEPISITSACGDTSQVYDISLDPFFNKVLHFSLKFARVDKMEVRFNTCFFITKLLQNIGNNVELDQSLCDIIIDSIVDLLQDSKPNIRMQAIKALMRLQDPANPDCLVLKSFWTLSTDPNVEVRKAIVNHVAAHPKSIANNKMRLNDKDPSVRQAAYLKFAEINPKLYLKIVDRNAILTCGFTDSSKKTQHIFEEKLLPKWLAHFEWNYLQFFKALRLDADENDINNFQQLCSKLLNLFLKSQSLPDIVKCLPVDNTDKVIPVPQLKLESIFYWSGVIDYLRKIEDGEFYLENILPELTPFSNYIEKVLKEKSSATMDEWENLEFQSIVCQLFKIASGYDMSDEVGRKTFYSLILQILTTYKLQQRVIDQILQVALLLNTDKSSLIIDLCQIISDIREPLIEDEPSEDQLRTHNFDLTLLKVKLHQLEIDEEQALKKKDFQHAHIVHNEIEKYQKEFITLTNKYAITEKVRISKDDPETLCRCLDILIGLLKVLPQNTVSVALQSCRDEFLIPLLSNNSSEVHWRFILSLGLFSLLDKDLAFQHTHILCIPIATYRTIPNYDKLALKTSVACLSDLIRIHGIEVLGIHENSPSFINQSTNQTTSRRRLYSENSTEPEVLNKDNITVETIIDIILDMIEDEDEGVRYNAITSIGKLIGSNFPVSPEIISRLILKWYNPEAEKKDPKLHQMLGQLIECFSKITTGAKKIVRRAIFPIISSIVNASATSPLLEIDIENVLRFLTVLTSTVNENDTENIHNQIAAETIERLLNKPNDACTPHLVKLLTYLKLNFDNIDECKKLLSSTESLLSDLVDKIPKKNLAKFGDTLKDGMKVFDEADTINSTDNGISVAGQSRKEIEEDQSLSRSNSIVDEVPRSKKHKKTIHSDITEKDSDGQERGNFSDSVADSVETQSLEEVDSGKLPSANIVPFKRCFVRIEPLTESELLAVQVNKESCIKTSKHSRKSGRLSTECSAVIVNEETNCDIRSFDTNEFEPLDTSSNNNENKMKATNSKKLSQIVLKNTSKAKGETDELVQKNPQPLIRTRLSKSKLNESTDSIPFQSPKKEQLKKISKNTNIPVLSRKTPKLTPLKISTEKRVDKRMAVTPLSAIVDRKTKRLTKNPAFPFSPGNTTKESTNTPSTGRNRSTSNCSLNTVQRRSLRNALKDNSNSNSKLRSQKNPAKSFTSPKVIPPIKLSKKNHGNSTNQVQKNIEGEKYLRDKSLSKNTRSFRVENFSGMINKVTESVKEKDDTPKNIRSPSVVRVNRLNNSRNREYSKKTRNSHVKSGKTSEKEGNESVHNTDYRNKRIQEIHVTKPTQEKGELEDVEAKSKNKNTKYRTDQTGDKNKLNATVRNNDNSKERVKSHIKLKQIESKSNIENKKNTKTNNSDEKMIETSDMSNSERITRSKNNKDIIKTKEYKTNDKIKELRRNKRQKSSSPQTKMELKNNMKSTKSVSPGDVQNGVLQSLNNFVNHYNSSAVSRRSPRISIRQQNRSLSQTRFSLNGASNKRNSASKKLDFSSFSDETILKTFLQGDEEIQPREDISIENISSFSNISSCSKKENLSINVSTSSNSSRMSTRTKRSRIDVSPKDFVSPPRKIRARTKR